MGDTLIGFRESNSPPASPVKTGVATIAPSRPSSKTTSKSTQTTPTAAGKQVAVTATPLPSPSRTDESEEPTTPRNEAAVVAVPASNGQAESDEESITPVESEDMFGPTAKSSSFHSCETPPRFNRSADSFQGSLESMDSLVESYWDPEDDETQLTPIATNTVEQKIDFFEEHIDFMRVKTQARKVQVVWASPP